MSTTDTAATDTWFSELLRTHQAMLGPFSAYPAVAPWLQAAQALQDWHQQALAQMTAQMTALWPAAAAFGLPGRPAAPAADKRFAADAWRQDPRFAPMVQTYLAQAEQWRKALDVAPLDERSKAQWGFLTRQVVDALSPANHLLTNPEALQTALQSGGTSLIEGAKLFMQDFAKGRISMTDDTAFEVGRNVAVTPGSVVFENDLMQLIQYQPTTDRVHELPLLVVPPCINKFYILDLQPENSLVAYAAAQGHTVFLVSWRNIDESLGHLGWDDYLEQGVLQAMQVACDIAGSERLNALGFCLGGTLLTCAQAVLAARGVDRLASMTLLTTMLDFSDTGELGLMVTEPSMALRDAAIGEHGVLHGRELAQVFAALRANDLIWPYVINGYLQGKAPPAFDLLYWNSDDSNLPGPMACWYMRTMYLENRLREPGATVQCGEPVDLGLIDTPTFLYASREDHIVPWKTAYLSTQLLSGELRFVLGASGHIAGVINPPAKKKRSHWVGPVGDRSAFDPDPDRWLAQAQEVPGSWWPAWSAWLAEHAGAQVPARRALGNADHPPLEPAPGRYVQAKAS